MVDLMGSLMRRNRSYVIFSIDIQNFFPTFSQLFFKIIFLVLPSVEVTNFGVLRVVVVILC